MLCWVMSRKKNIRDRRLEKKIRALEERRFLSIFDFSPSSIFHRQRCSCSTCEPSHGF
ncbi:hypothetical protein YC2023_007819 [Brassica napus]